MTTHRTHFQSVIGPAWLLIGLVLFVWPGGTLEAGSEIRLSWDANSDLDLAGYRIHYGTSSHNYSLPTLNVGQVTTFSVPNLQANTTYYFVVTALDNAGNESAPSNEVAAQPPPLPAPSINGAFELETNSGYILQSGDQVIQVNGANFQNGAVVALGSGVTVGPSSLLDAARLTAPILVAPSAPLGPRALSVTNPDGGAASMANALTVVKTTDINRDCRIDLVDLNLLARAWNTLSSDGAYLAAADLDGDGEVGGLDLDILVTYLGQPLAVCP